MAKTYAVSVLSAVEARRWNETKFNARDLELLYAHRRITHAASKNFMNTFLELKYPRYVVPILKKAGYNVHECVLSRDWEVSW